MDARRIQALTIQLLPPRMSLSIAKEPAFPIPFAAPDVRRRQLILIAKQTLKF
jgi:hypothetical protein